MGCNPDTFNTSRQYIKICNKGYQAQQQKQTATEEYARKERTTIAGNPFFSEKEDSIIL